MSDLFDFDKPDQYAVMGNPIKHSKSPQIHTAFAQQTGQNIEYHAIHVDVGGFGQAASHFQGHGGKGLNVTVPFKLKAWKLAEKLSERAQRAGAVNTLLFKDNTIIGDNTDGFGLVSDITQQLGWLISAQRILILGAGGAARGVIAPILAHQPQSLFIANRTASKAIELAELFSDIAPIDAGGYAHLKGQQFDLIINATAASLQGEVPPLPDNLIHSNSACYDMMYAAKPTAFMHWATQQGVVNIADGLGMLVAQAAESFRLWRGIMPDSKVVINMIRQTM
jgi:shikimate dehydrogenase